MARFPAPRARNTMAWISGAVFVLALIAVAWGDRHELHPDAIAYIRIAQYTVRLDTSRMISAYWGPLLSWLMAPFLLVFGDRLLAARAAMAISAVIFVAGSMAVLRTLRIPTALRALALYVCMAFAVVWSTEAITPDLLLSGLLCLGIAGLLSDGWWSKPSIQMRTGLFFGVACLTKAVALPYAVLLTCVYAVLAGVARGQPRRETVRATAVTLSSMAPVILPWIVVLSTHYGRLLFSSSGSINYALTGPPDVFRGHPVFGGFIRPEAGRITTWEDPTTLEYPTWSPFASTAYFAYQVRSIVRHVLRIPALLRTFDAADVGLICALFAPWANRERLVAEPWRWSALPMAVLFGIYSLMPIEQRYLLPCYAFLLCATLGMLWHLSGVYRRDHRWRERMVGAVFVISFGGGVLPMLFVRAVTLNHPPGNGIQLANAMAAADMRGPIAAAGSIARAGQEALYAAFILNEPFYGASPGEPSVAEIEASGARFIVTVRDSNIAASLAASPDFMETDTRLYGAPEAAANHPLAVFEQRGVGRSEDARPRTTPH